MLIMSEPDTIRNGFLQIRYIGRGITEPFAKSMAYDYPVLSFEVKGGLVTCLSRLISRHYLKYQLLQRAILRV